MEGECNKGDGQQGGAEDRAKAWVVERSSRCLGSGSSREGRSGREEAEEEEEEKEDSCGGEWDDSIVAEGGGEEINTESDMAVREGKTQHSHRADAGNGVEEDVEEREKDGRASEGMQWSCEGDGLCSLVSPRCWWLGWLHCGCYSVEALFSVERRGCNCTAATTLTFSAASATRAVVVRCCCCCCCYCYPMLLTRCSVLQLQLSERGGRCCGCCCSRPLSIAVAAAAAVSRSKPPSKHSQPR